MAFLHTAGSALLAEVGLESLGAMTLQRSVRVRSAAVRAKCVPDAKVQYSNAGNLRPSLELQDFGQKLEEVGDVVVEIVEENVERLAVADLCVRLGKRRIRGPGRLR